MNGKELYKIYAPIGAKWVNWVRPVSFVAIDTYNREPFSNWVDRKVLFLEKYEEFKTLYSYCIDAETFVYSKPSLCGMLCRNALEYTLKLFYKVALPNVEVPTSNFDMITNTEFVQLIEDDEFVECLHFVRKL